MRVRSQTYMGTLVAQATTIVQMSLRTGFYLTFFFTLKLIFILTEQYG